MRQDGGSPRGTFWYQSPFRSDREGNVWQWAPLLAFFMVWVPLMSFGVSPLVIIASITLLVVIQISLWFAWIVWGRDAFPLPDQGQAPTSVPGDSDHAEPTSPTSG